MDRTTAIVVVLLVACSLIDAIEKPNPFYPETLYRRHLAPWTRERSATQDDIVHFTVALKQRNIKKFDEIFWQITDPSNSNYGNWMHQDDILDLIAPSQEDHDRVLNWLNSVGGIVSIKDHRDAFQVQASASTVEQLLNTKLHVFVHKTKGTRAIRQSSADSYHIPYGMSDIVEFVTGLTDFPYFKKDSPVARSQTLAKQSAPVWGYVIPETIRRIYNIPTGTVVTNPGTSQSVMEFVPSEEPAPDFSDMVTFAAQAGEIFTNITYIVGDFLQGGGGEPTLDVELLYSIAPKAENWYWTVNNGWALEMALELFNAEKFPQVVSVSWGWPEVFTCQSDVTGAMCNGTSNGATRQYVERSNIELQKVAAKGISVLICTQDEGAPSEANMDCSLDNTTTPVFSIYPSSSPFVTAVSATTVGPESATLEEQMAQPPICTGYGCALSNVESPCQVNNTFYTWTTGGGFSTYSLQPDYQSKQVAAFFASNSIVPPEGTFNATGRGYADVTATGARLLIWDDGSVEVSAGTSASTPTFAGVVTLLNDYRLNNGKKALGFLNPLLYQMAAKSPKTFNDIQFGDNRCTSGVCCLHGYGSAHGWDPVSGLGSPNYQEMIKYISTLP